jgi:hypothetical protein
MFQQLMWPSSGRYITKYTCMKILQKLMDPMHWFHAERRTDRHSDMTKLIVVFRDVVNASNIMRDQIRLISQKYGSIRLIERRI